MNVKDIVYLLVLIGSTGALCAMENVDLGSNHDENGQQLSSEQIALLAPLLVPDIVGHPVPRSPGVPNIVALTGYEPDSQTTGNQDGNDGDGRRVRRRLNENN